MRADRLIAVLLLLQRKGSATAAEVAAELEVSERTARRDLEALAVSGVPVYSTAGRGGGWSLVGGASTDLTGLVAGEARALFLAIGPTMAANPELQSALRKLAAALPETFRDEAEAAAGAVKVDFAAWGHREPSDRPEFVGALSESVIGGNRVRVDYDSRRGTKGVRDLHPLGLVTKRNVWYLVAGVGDSGAEVAESIRSYRVDRVRSIEELTDRVIRPKSFDLDSTWEDIRTQVEALRVSIDVRVRATRWVMGYLRWVFGPSHVESVSPLDSKGWQEAVIGAQNPKAFAVQIAGWGNQVEILDAPDEVFEHLARIAAELTQTYPANP